MKKIWRTLISVPLITLVIASCGKPDDPENQVQIGLAKVQFPARFGGTGNDTLCESGGSNITLVGGSGNDTLASPSPSPGLGGSGGITLSGTGGSSITM